MRKRVWAWIMTIMMVISMMPTTAFAGINDTTGQTGGNQTSTVKNQIGDYYEVDDTTGALSASPTLEEGSTEQSYEDGKVKVNKTITATDEENVFNITLTVKTQELLQESTADAATVIVIDCSGSMKYCINCGHEHKEGENTCGHKEGQGPNSSECNCSDNSPRYAAAQQAAQTFINSFKSTDNNVARKVAIVKFNGYKGTNSSSAETVQTWTDASKLATVNNSTIHSTIQNLTANGGTNIEAGLMLARNLLRQDVKNSAGESITNKNLILLTDGRPTYGVVGDYTSTTVIGANGTNIEGSGSDTTCDTNDKWNENTPDTHKDAEELAQYIKNTLEVNTYGVYVGEQDVECEDCDLDTNGAGWLSNYCGFTAYAANNLSALTDLFKNLADLISLKTQAWIVTDPMGDNVELESITPDNSHNPISTYKFEDGKIKWDIKAGCLPVKTETTGDGENKVTTYTYQLSYKVRLDTLADDFAFSDDESNNWYATNGVTGLTYLIEGDTIPTTVDTAYFNVPSVKGFAADLSFNKVGSFGEALSGAKFTLTHDECSCGTHDDEDDVWSMTATSDADGNVSFEDIPSGHTYTLTETKAPGTSGQYTKSDKTYTVEVSYGELAIKDKDGEDVDLSKLQFVNESDTTTISGTKTWDDADNQDGIRPESIEVTLTGTVGNGNNATTVSTATKTVEADSYGNWSYSFTDLPKYKGGVEITYAVSEATVSGYTPTYDGYNITNTHTPETIDIRGTKTWNDANNQDGKRPDSITVNLLANGNKVKTTTATSANNWAWSFTGVDKYKDGEEITYTVTEEAVSGYEAEVNGFAITNTHTPEKTSITVAKVWNDGNNQDGIRPDNITVKLLAGGTDTGKTLTLSPENWSGSFTDLDKYKNGTEIKYTIEEVNVNGYTSTIKATDDETGFVITNTHTPETTSINGTKTWNDANNQDGKRPESITVNLLADGKAALDADGEAITAIVTADANGDWTYSFTNLPKYKNGKEIVYTVTENAVENYSTTINGYDITNTHTPETTSVAGTKTWMDGNNQDGKRPTSITVNLLANGKSIDSKTVKAGENGNWSYSFTDLPKYENGKEITYTVTENAITDYTTTISGYNITNTHVPETTGISGTKTWDDDGNRDGKRPSEIIVNLLADGQPATDKDGNAITKTVKADKDGNWSYSFTDLPKKANGKDITYTVSETAVDNYSTTYDGNNITNSYTPAKTSITVTKAWDDADNQDGIRPDSITVKLYTKSSTTPVASLVLNEANNWIGTFTDLNVNSFANGVSSPIEYYVVEEIPESYTSAQSGDLVNGIVITNTHTPETVSVDGTKTWDDNDNKDGKRPSEITVNLLADGKPATDADGKAITATVTADNNWSYSFTDLPKFKDEGKTIEYTVTEDEVDGYDATVDGYNITNTHEPETVDISGTKTWKDGDNQDGVRPESIKINLLADGQPATDKDGEAITATVKADKDGNWSWSFNNLPKYKEGKVGQEIAYTVTENAVEGYTTKVEGYNIINTHEVEKTSISVAKVWNDDENRDKIRPDEITVSLLANGSDTGKTVKLNEANSWKASFDNLDKNSGGEAIEYTVNESGLPEGYTSEVTGDMAIGYTITNSHSYATVSIGGTKTWNDGDNQDGIRPDSITVRLYADGTEVNSQTVAGTDGTWSYSFSTDKDGKTLPKYNKGKEIEYTVSEDAVEGYTTAVSGYNITNTHTPSVTSLSGSKTWNDNGDQDGVRPDSITVRLHADGTEIDSRTVTAASGWSWSFTNLPVNKAGTAISYTITEDAVEGYIPDINGSNITNTHSPDKTSVAVSKSWNDDNNRDGKRASVTVALYADGASTGKTLTLSKENGWTGTFTGLDKNKEGKEIAYTVQETNSPEGYTASITGSADKGYTITNSYEPAKTSVSGSKTWKDDGDRDGKRPDAITVRLFADGEQIDQKVVSEASGWSWSFDNLYKYENGKEINYTITEDEVAGYTTEINGFDITNTYDDFETTEVTVTKTWKDDSNGDRPDAITVELLADGEVIQTVDLTAGDNWAYTFKDLPMYAEGKSGVKVVYSVNEKPVEGYTTEIAGFEITNTKIPPQDDTPKTPVTPDKPDKPASSDNAAKTGDNMNIFALAGTALAALAGAFAALFRRKKKA